MRERVAIRRMRVESEVGGKTAARQMLISLYANRILAAAYAGSPADSVAAGCVAARRSPACGVPALARCVARVGDPVRADERSLRRQSTADGRPGHRTLQHGLHDRNGRHDLHPIVTSIGRDYSRDRRGRTVA